MYEAKYLLKIAPEVVEWEKLILTLTSVPTFIGALPAKQIVENRKKLRKNRNKIPETLFNEIITIPLIFLLNNAKNNYQDPKK